MWTWRKEKSAEKRILENESEKMSGPTRAENVESVFESEINVVFDVKYAIIIVK